MIWFWSFFLLASLQPRITHKAVEDLILELPPSNFFQSRLIHKPEGELISQLPSPNLFPAKDNPHVNGGFEFEVTFSCFPPAKEKQQGSARFDFELPSTNFFPKKDNPQFSWGYFLHFSWSLDYGLVCWLKSLILRSCFLIAFSTSLKNCVKFCLSWLHRAFSDGSFLAKSIQFCNLPSRHIHFQDKKHGH